MPFLPPSIEYEILDGGLSSGVVAPPDGPMWILGPAAQGTIAPFPASQAQDVKSTFAHGAGVEASMYALNNELSSITFLPVDMSDATAGVYGTITVTSQGAGITVAGDGTIKPGDDWEPIVRWSRGGTIGVLPGPQYEYSLDNGQKFSGTRDLGTDTSITLPFGGGKYNLVGLELTTLLARYVEVRTDFLAHAAEFGAYHGVVDPNSPYTIPTPTNDATILTCAAALLSSASNHVDEVGGVHGAADATAATALAALTAPSTRAEAIEFIEDFVAIVFGDGSTVNSGHTLRTASSIHTVADTVNVLASDPAVAGDVVAGDAFSVTNTGPRWSIDKLVEALGTVKDSAAPCNGVLEIVGNVLTSNEAQAIEDALEAISTKYRDVRAIGHFRRRNANESLQTYATAFEAAHPLAASSGRQGRLTLTAWYYPPSQLVPGAAAARPASFALAARYPRTPIATNAISEVDFGTLKGAVRASNGTTVLPAAADESFAPVCTPVRLWALRSDPSGILASRPVTLAPDGSDFALVHYGRVIDAVKKSSYRSLKLRMGQKVAPKPGTTYIDPNEAKRIGEAESKKLFDAFVKTGQAAGTRVVIEENSVVSGAGTKITYVSIYVRPVGYFEDIRVRLQFEL